MPDFEQRQLAYQAAMALARRMLSKGLISEEQYAEIDTIIAKKYGISSCSIFRGNCGIYRAFRGNMSHTPRR